MQEREYLLRPEGHCWVGKNIGKNTTAMVTRYTDKMVFACEYDGIPMGTEFSTGDVDAALSWLHAC